MFDELIYSDVQKCLLKWDSMYFYVCYSELNLLGKVLLKIFNVILCRVWSSETFNENNKLLVRRVELGE